MSVPPQIIQVKRKRNDDGPVDFLRIEQSTKRQRSGAFLYQRRDPEAALGKTPVKEPASSQPVIHASRPGEENLPLEAVKRSHAAAAASGLSNQTSTTTTPSKTQPTTTTNGPKPPSPAKLKDAPSSTANTTQPGVPASVAARVMIEPRRFHLSRDHRAQSRSVLGSRVVKTPSTSRSSSPAMFVERTRRKHASRAKLEKSTQSRPSSSGKDTAAAEPAPRRPKPSSSRGMTLSVRPKAPALPDSLVNRCDADMDRLTREMNDYTLEYIARDLERIKALDAAAAPKRPVATPKKTPSSKSTSTAQSSSPSPMRFKPHAPAKRYAERHPEEAAAAAAAATAEAQKEHGVSGMDIDSMSDTDEDESSYVIDTYVRVAADTVEAEATPDKVGLLVLDEPDVSFFYGEESDSEEEFEDDEDENAENYYTADYPDDEVASGDEFGRDAYLYRTGNASDLEEFDNGRSSSDESDEEDIEERFKITIGQPQNLPQLY